MACPMAWPVRSGRIATSARLPWRSACGAGQIDVNGAPFNLQAPFGGFGQSGVGRENGRFGMDEFVELRSIQMPKRAAS